MLEKEVPFLEEELEIRKKEVAKLRANKTENIKPTNEIVSFREQNKEREELCERKINLIEFYYENQERFQQSYEKGTLESLLENYSNAEQETIEMLLEKDNRKH